jgi:hypothetical protein
MNDLFLHREMARELQASADSLLSVIGTWRFFYNQCNSHLVEALELVNAQLEQQNEKIRSIENELRAIPKK